MKRRRLIILSIAAVAVVVGLWMLAGSHVDMTALTRTFGSPPPQQAAKTKPICSQVIVPAGDCIPQHLANLPPDPGPEGMKTIEGIDSDKDGVRDDVQRYIAEKWGHSERAVKALTLIAKNAQLQVKLGDNVNRDEAYEIAKKMSPMVTCYSLSVDSKSKQGRALDYVESEVTNTPARFERWQKFEQLTANRVYLSPDLSEVSLSEVCGYDPAKLPN